MKIKLKKNQSNKHENRRSWLGNRSGFVSIETIWAMTFFLLAFFLLIGFYTFIRPYTTIGRDVHDLSVLAQRQGGLTIEDVDNFKAKLAEYPFVDESKGEIEINAYTTPGDMDAIGVDGLDEAGDYYVKRDSKEFIDIVVRVPAYNEVLTPIVRVFNATGVPQTYTFKETVMSERY